MEIDCSGTDNMICPYCGKEIEVDDFDPKGKQNCHHCDKNFECEPDYSVTYTTWKMPCYNGEPHEFKSTLGWISEPGEKRPYNCKQCGFTKWE